MLEQIYYIPVDKLLHIIIGMLIALMVIFLLDELRLKTKFLLLLILGLALNIGILKESYDLLYKSDGYWDDIDIIFTLIGSTLPYIVKIKMKFLVKLFGGLKYMFYICISNNKKNKNT